MSSCTRTTENLILEMVPGPSGKPPKISNENMDEINLSLKREITTDLATIVAENQKEMFLSIKKRTNPETVPESDFEGENTSPVVPTLTPTRTENQNQNLKTTPCSVVTFTLSVTVSVQFDLLMDTFLNVG